MTTAVSLPDSLCHSADALAAKLKVSRDGLLRLALTRFIEENDRARITENINKFIDENGQPEFDERMAQANYEILKRVEW